MNLHENVKLKVKYAPQVTLSQVTEESARSTSSKMLQGSEGIICLKGIGAHIVPWWGGQLHWGQGCQNSMGHGKVLR